MFVLLHVNGQVLDLYTMHWHCTYEEFGSKTP
jgi:hypothetical protein